MRLQLGLGLSLLLLASACTEAARCAEDHTGPVVQCSTGKVAACGNDRTALYHSSGALLPVARPPADPEAPEPGESPSGACDVAEVDTRLGCRTRPTCATADGPPTCATGETVYCFLGDTGETAEVVAPVDAGPPPPVDAGPDDAGSDDAGPDDAGPIDAGVDAGP